MMPSIGTLVLAMFLAFIMLAIIITCANLIQWYGQQHSIKNGSSKEVRPGDLVVPADQFILLRVLLDEKGHASLSTFQFLLWTLVISFFYISLWFLHLLSGDLSPPPVIQAGLIELMGISVVIPLASKGVSEYKKFKPRKNGETYKEPDYASMLEEKGQPSLLRLQMFLWTIAAIVIFAGQFINSILTTPDLLGVGLPLVDPSLLYLMGLSQTGYLGSKAFSGTVTLGSSPTNEKEGKKHEPSPTVTAPVELVKQPLAIREVIPRSVKVKELVTILGSGFGIVADTLMFGQEQVQASSIKRWEDSRIEFVVPDWIVAGTYALRIISGGNTAGEQITVTAPSWARGLNEIDAEIKGAIWIDDPSQKNYRCPLIGYFVVGKRYHFFFEFEVKEGTPAWGRTQFKATFYVDGVKIRDLSVLPGYINGQNYGVFDYVFDDEKTYTIQIQGANKVEMKVDARRRKVV
jgi:hypothetical protein